MVSKPLPSKRTAAASLGLPVQFPTADTTVQWSTSGQLINEEPDPLSAHSRDRGIARADQVPAASTSR